MKCEKCGKDMIMTVPVYIRRDLRNFDSLCVCDPEDPCVKGVLDLKKRCEKESKS